MVGQDQREILDTLDLNVSHKSLLSKPNTSWGKKKKNLKQSLKLGQSKVRKRADKDNAITFLNKSNKMV